MFKDGLTSIEVAAKYGIKESTLRSWRRLYMLGDDRFPRFHKLTTGSVYYIQSEIEEDLAKMEININKRMVI